MTLSRHLAPLPIIALISMLACTGSTPPKPTDQTADSTSNIMNRDVTRRLNQMGDSALQLGHYLEAMALYQQALDTAALEGDSMLYYDSKLDIACVHFRTGDIQKAIEVAEETTDAFSRSGDSSRLGRAYDALAGYYGRNNQLEKSQEAHNKGFELLKQHGDLIHRCVAYNQEAFIHSDAGNWQTARFYLDTALLLMNQSGVIDQRAGIYLNLGDCYRNLGMWNRANEYLRAAEREADSLGHAHIEARAILRLSQVAEATGAFSEALALFQKSVSLKDSMFNADKMSQLQALEADYEVREKEQQIATLASERKAAIAHRNFAVSLTLLLVVLAFFLFFSYRTKLATSQKMLEQHQHHLNEYAQLLLSKNARLSALEQQTEQLQNIQNEQPELSPELENESFYNSRILTDTEWEHFKRRFENAYPGYLLKLRRQYPALSNAEERLFLLIKLGFNSQEIADTLGITANAVKKGRQRLRRRLDLQPEEDLEQFILQLKF